MIKMALPGTIAARTRSVVQIAAEGKRAAFLRKAFLISTEFWRGFAGVPINHHFTFRRKITRTSLIVFGFAGERILLPQILRRSRIHKRFRIAKLACNKG